MHIYEVGKPYNESRDKWPEATQFNYRSGEAELTLFFNSPKPQEVAGVKSGKAEFALVVEQGLIVLLFQFHKAGLQPMGGSPTTAIPWSEGVFNWWRVPEREQQVPGDEPSEQSRQLLHILMVDASTGILLVNRAVTLSPEFTVTLRSAIRAQALGAPFYNEEDLLRGLYQRYPQTPPMAQGASARCLGGS